MPTTGSPGTPTLVQRSADYFRPPSQAISPSRAARLRQPSGPVKKCTESPLKSAKQAYEAVGALARPVSRLRPQFYCTLVRYPQEYSMDRLPPFTNSPWTTTRIFYTIWYHRTQRDKGWTLTTISLLELLYGYTQTHTETASGTFLHPLPYPYFLKPSPYRLKLGSMGCPFVLTQYRRVTYGQTDRRTDRNAVGRPYSSTAAHCKIRL